MRYDEEVKSKKQLSTLIGDRIRWIRNQKGISQAELARRCGKDKQHIELIENAKVSPNIYSLYLISVALEVSLSDLFKF